MFEKVSQAILALFAANVKVEKFYAYEASNLGGFPAVCITPSGNDADYRTTTENARVYAFRVAAYIPRGTGNSNEETCEKAMRDLVDTLLDAVDRAHSSLAVEAQSGYTFMKMEAAPSRWGYAGRENEMRVAEIEVRVQFDVDVDTI